jgi:hypothetical protein
VHAAHGARAAKLSRFPIVRSGEKAMNLSLRAIVLVGLLVSACASRRMQAPVQPPTPTPTTPPDESSTAIVGGCWSFGSLPPAETLSLVGDRLRIEGLLGMHDQPRLHDIMAADASSTDETRLVLEDGDRKLVLYSVELWATAPRDLATAARALLAEFVSVPPEQMTPTSVDAHGLEVAAFLPGPVPASREDVPVLAAMVVPPDRHPLSVAFFVTPNLPAPACQELSRRLASTLVAGPRALDLAARDIVLSDVVRAHVPAGWGYSMQRGPDFDVHRLQRIGPLGKLDPQLGVYVGRYPETPEPAKRTLSGRMFGRPVRWGLSTTDSGLFAEVLTQPYPDGLAIHVWAIAADRASLDAARAIAESFTLAPRE